MTLLIHLGYVVGKSCIKLHTIFIQLGKKKTKKLCENHVEEVLDECSVLLSMIQNLTSFFFFFRPYILPCNWRSEKQLLHTDTNKEREREREREQKEDS